jgi:acetoacetate decarboxylase
MKLADVRAAAFAMPLTNPAYPRGPYKFYDREFVVITYRTDPDALRAVVPEPLEVAGDTVNYEFIRMPDSTGFGDYTETGQVIPVRFRGSDGVSQEGGYVHAMYLDDNSPIAGGREIWDSRRNSPPRRYRTRTRLSCVRCIMARCSVSRRRWATSITRSIASPCSRALPNRTS